MSKFKDYFFDHGIEDAEEMNEKNFFRCETNDELATAIVKEIPELRELYEQLFPATEEKTWYRYFCKDPKEGVFASFGLNDREKFIKDLMYLSDKQLDVYYCPATYKINKHKAKYVKNVRCLIVDIDETEKYFIPIQSTKEEIIDYIKRTYNLNDGDLSQYILCTGHGLHLLWLLPEPIDGDSFKALQQRLSTRFRSDFSVSSPAHQFRIPLGWNVKDVVPIKSKLYKINNGRIDFNNPNLFGVSTQEVDEYKCYCNDRKNEKSEATMAKNGTKRGRKPKAKTGKESAKEKSKKKSESGTKENKKEKVMPENYKGKEVTVENIHSVLNLRHYERGHNDINIAKDLIHYIIRREGQVYGYRNKLTHLISNYLAPHLKEEDLQELILQLFDDEFADEAISIVDQAYINLTKPRKEEEKHGPYYKYVYSDIAELLDFDQRDINESYSAFSEERRRIATRERVRRHRAKKSQAIKERKEEQYEVVKNSNKTAKELAFFLGISERTVYRIRKQIREDIKIQETEQNSQTFTH